MTDSAATANGETRRRGRGTCPYRWFSPWSPSMPSGFPWYDGSGWAPPPAAYDWFQVIVMLAASPWSAFVADVSSITVKV